MSPSTWKELEVLAHDIVSKTIAELPLEIQVEALKVPCLFQDKNEEDPDLLGVYCEFTPGLVSEANGPIILYLAAIADFCDEDGADFAEEVRLTYLHELGHHLGWDEGDLEERGLD